MSFRSALRLARHVPRHNRPAPRRLLLESLEDRAVPSTITWVNRGSGSFDLDNFNATYGGSAASARNIVDQAIVAWQNVIDDFNYANVGVPGWAPVRNTYFVRITGAALPDGTRGDAIATTIDPSGKPFGGEVRMDNDGGGAGWFFDPRPDDNAEFTGLLTRFTARFTGGLVDYYRTAVHELGHTLGLSLDSRLMLSRSGALSNAGTDQVDRSSALRLFNRNGTRATFTANGGGHIYEGPVDPLFPTAPVFPNELMNPGRALAAGVTRQLITDIDARLLAEAYNYAVRFPSNVQTFLANLNRVTGALTLNPDPQVLHNTFTVTLPGNLRVDVDGTVAQFAAGSITSVGVLGSAGNDVINLHSSVQGRPVTVTLGSANATLNVSPSDRKLGNVRVPVTVLGRTGRVNLFDDFATGTDTYTITSTTVRLAGAPAFGFDYPAPVDSLVLTAGVGIRTANVRSTPQLTAVTVSGADVVTVGNSGSAQNHLGLLTVNNPSRLTALNVENWADAGNRGVTLNTGSLTGLSPGAINFVPAALRSLMVEHGGLVSGGSTFNVFNTPTRQTTLFCGNGRDTVNVQRTTGPLTVHGMASNDTINLGNSGNRLDDLAGAVTVEGGAATDTITVNDQGTTAAQTYTITGTTASRTGVALITYGTIDTLVVNAGAGNDTINVRSTAAGVATTVHGNNGNDTFNVGGTDDRLYLNGDLTVHGQGGANQLVVSDYNTSAPGTTYDITFLTVSRPLNGNRPISYSSLADLTLKAGYGGNLIRILSTAYGTSTTVNAGGGGNTIQVRGTAAGTATTVNAGAGNDTITVGNTADQMDDVQGALTVNSGGGTNALTFNDQGPGTARSYTLTAATLERASAGLITFAGTFAAPQRLTLNLRNVTMGSGLNFVYVRGTAASINVTTVNVFDNLRTWLYVGGSDGLLNSIQGALTIAGPGRASILSLGDSQNPADQIYTATAATVTRTGMATISYASVNTLVLSGGRGRDQFVVLGTPADVSVEVNLGAGNDSVWVRNNLNRLDDLLGPLTVRGEADSDTLIINDQNTSAAKTYTVTAASVQRSDRAMVSYATVESVSLDGGSGGNRLDVDSTAAGVLTTVNGHNGNDTFTVGTGNNLGLMQGRLVVDGRGGNDDSVSLNDQSTGFVWNYRFLANRLTRAGVDISWFSERLTLNAGGAGGTTINVEAVPAGTAMTVNAGAHNDTINVGGPSNTLAPIVGTLTVNGQGGIDTLQVFDHGTTTAQTYTVTALAVARSGGPTITYGTVDRLTLYGGSGGNAVLIPSTAAVVAATTVNAGFGSDTITVGNPTLDAIAGLLVVNGQDGTDRLNLDDGGNCCERAHEITATTHRRTIGATVAIDYGSLESLVFAVGGNVTVLSTSATTPVTLNLSGGTPTVNVGSAAGSLDTLQGELSLYGGAQGARLNINDQAASGPVDYTIEHTPYTYDNYLRRTGAAPIYFDHQVGLLTVYSSPSPHTFTVLGLHNNGSATLFGSGADRLVGPLGTVNWELTGSNAGTLSGTYPYLQAPVAFSGIADLQGDSGEDTFRFSEGAGVSGFIDGGGGVDTLDYALLAGDVVVNMPLYSATGVGYYLSQVENAIGGAGNDVLVGDHQSNVLDGGPGRDLLIAGGMNFATGEYSFLADTLRGGGGEDILIAGWTYYDNSDPGTLLYIRDVWADPTTSFEDRAGWLRPFLDETWAVYSNWAGNTLTGGDDDDWFFGLRAYDVLTEELTAREDASWVELLY